MHILYLYRINEEGEETQSGRKKKRVISKAFISDEEDSSGEEGKPRGEGVEPGLPSSSPTPRAEEGSSASSQSESEERLVLCAVCFSVEHECYKVIYCVLTWYR